jgi:hypothetical protein
MYRYMFRPLWGYHQVKQMDYYWMVTIHMDSCLHIRPFATNIVSSIYYKHNYFLLVINSDLFKFKIKARLSIKIRDKKNKLTLKSRLKLALAIAM